MTEEASYFIRLSLLQLSPIYKEAITAILWICEAASKDSTLGNKQEVDEEEFDASRGGVVLLYMEMLGVSFLQDLSSFFQKLFCRLPIYVFMYCYQGTSMTIWLSIYLSI